jgi:hypothetical protein
MAHTYNPSYLGGLGQENCSLRPSWANSLQDPISKITREKWTGGVTQAVQCLLCKCEALSINPSPTKKKRKKKKKEGVGGVGVALAIPILEGK